MRKISFSFLFLMCFVFSNIASSVPPEDEGIQPEQEAFQAMLRHALQQLAASFDNPNPNPIPNPNPNNNAVNPPNIKREREEARKRRFFNGAPPVDCKGGGVLGQKRPRPDDDDNSRRGFRGGLQPTSLFAQ